MASVYSARVTCWALSSAVRELLRAENASFSDHRVERHVVRGGDDALDPRQFEADADRQREIIVAEAYRDAQKIKGEGDAKASALYADAFGKDPQFAQFYRSLEAYRASFRSKSDVMVVDQSNEFFKNMRGNGTGAAR